MAADLTAPTGDVDGPAVDERPLLRRLPRPVVIAGGALASVGIAAGAYLLTADPTPEPEVLFAQSLDMVGRGDWVRAHNVGLYLRENGYADLDFPGGVPFVLGESSFQLGDQFSLDRHTREGHYNEAARELLTAEEDGLPIAYREQWTRSLGLSLYRLGRLAEAEPRLAEAAMTGDPVSILALGRCRLVPAADAIAAIDDTAAAAEALLARDDLEKGFAVEAALLRIDAWFEAGRHDAIRTALETTDWLPLPPDSPELTLRRARLELAVGDPRAADELAARVLAERSFSPDRLREAAYWWARAAEMDGRDTDAILRYRSVLDDYDPGEESIVAAVRLADLLRQAPRVLFEDALRAYARAVQIQSRPELYRNRYMPLLELRDRVRTAWQQWLDAGQYEWAIALAEQMAPLFERHDAAELAAEATHRQAIEMQARYAAADAELRGSLRPDLMRLWRESGHAYGRLAEALIALPGYEDALWTSFDHLRLGHDFDGAMRQLELFLGTETQSRRPQALVEYGRLLMDLHRPGDARLDRAAATFQTVLSESPTSDSAFDARLFLGHCLLEQDRPSEAVATWQLILDSPLLTPASRVWQEALVSLGDVLFHTGELTALKARQAGQSGDAETARTGVREANVLWNDAVSQLTGYLARTEYTRQAAAARFWLAKSLQRTTELPSSQLGSAETNNARIELQRQIDASLERAIAELRSLVRELDPRAERNRLDEVERRLLRDSVFEIAHTTYQLKRYETAADLYGDAINRFPTDPQVLLAYVQVAACYDRLDRRTEAVSYLERAQLIHGQFRDGLFDPELSSLSGPEWDVWLTRNLGLLKSEDDPGAGT